MFGHSGFSSQLKDTNSSAVYKDRPAFTISSNRQSSLSFPTEPLLQREMYKQVFDVLAYRVEGPLSIAYQEMMESNPSLLPETGPPPLETDGDDAARDIHPNQTAWDLRYYGKRTHPTARGLATAWLPPRNRLVSLSSSSSDVQTLIWRNTTKMDLVLNYATTADNLPRGRSSVNLVVFATTADQMWPLGKNWANQGSRYDTQRASSRQEVLEKEDWVRAVLEDPRVTMWYVVNPSHVHPKLRPMPLGVKFHWDLKQYLEQYPGIESRTEQRTNLLYCKGFQVHCCRHTLEFMNMATRIRRSWEWRREALRVLAANGFPHCTLARSDFGAYASGLSTSKFALSPRGVGISNFREWEALTLGAIPIIHRSPQHQFAYHDLPVVQIDKWEEVTPSFLEREWERIVAGVKDGKYNKNRAFWPFWMHELIQWLDDRSAKLQEAEDDEL
eukprot:scaffold3096_cov403-Prasinococcus_capsulatus_cf.AAC.8